MGEIAFTGTPVDLENVYCMLVSAGVPVLLDGKRIEPSWPRGGMWSKMPSLVATRGGVEVLPRGQEPDGKKFVEAAAATWSSGEDARRLDEFKRWLHGRFPSVKDRQAIVTSILQ